jgi:dCTP deaminase
MIRQFSLGDCPMLTPFFERSKVHGRSFGLSMAGYDIRLADELTIECGTYDLGHSVEHFHIPNNVLAIVADKSTNARMGIQVFNTIIEPGWKGYLTLEIHAIRRNGSITRFIKLNKLLPIAQVLFLQMADPPESVYSGKYQNQPAAAVEAILEVADGTP